MGFEVSGPQFPEVYIKNVYLNTGEELRRDTNDLTIVDCRIISKCFSHDSDRGN